MYYGLRHAGQHDEDAFLLQKSITTHRRYRNRCSCKGITSNSEVRGGAICLVRSLIPREHRAELSSFDACAPNDVNQYLTNRQDFIAKSICNRNLIPFQTLSKRINDLTLNQSHISKTAKQRHAQARQASQHTKQRSTQHRATRPQATKHPRGAIPVNVEHFRSVLQ